MTLKELIAQVSFDELLPYLMQRESEHLDNLCNYREAYDLLRLMEPNPDYTGEIQVEWEHGALDENEKWIGVSNMHDADWDEDLAKEIVVADDVHLGLEELAMHCLWEITFYGFSPEQREDTFSEMFEGRKPKNKYDVALDKLEDSIWRHQTPRKYRDKSLGMRCISADFFMRRVSDHPLNRAKRKRKYRQMRRKRYLKTMSMRENLVQALSVPESSFVRSDVDFLCDVEYGV